MQVARGGALWIVWVSTRTKCRTFFGSKCVIHALCTYPACSSKYASDAPSTPVDDPFIYLGSFAPHCQLNLAYMLLLARMLGEALNQCRVSCCR